MVDLSGAWDDAAIATAVGKVIKRLVDDVVLNEATGRPRNNG